LFEGHQRPLGDRMPGLRDQFARRAKLGQSRGPECRALEDRRRLAGSAWTGAYCGGLHSLASVRALAIAPLYGGSPAGGPARKGRLGGFRYEVSKGVGAGPPWFPINSMACPRYEWGRKGGCEHNEFNVLPEGGQGGKGGEKQASGIGGGSNE